MEKIKLFFKTVSLFIFCLQMIYSGYTLNIKKINFKEIWNYCKQWEKGEL